MTHSFFSWRLLSFLFVLISLFCSLPSAHAAKVTKPAKENETQKERLVLMPLRVPADERNLTGAMETALVEGLQNKYEVFSGERVQQKAKEIFNKESKSAKKECDETRCMQDIAVAFQAELIATANVTKSGGGYFIALSIQNIFDNRVVYSKSLPCEECNAFQVVNKLKELIDTPAEHRLATADEKPQLANGTDLESTTWNEAQRNNTLEDYQVYLDAYPKGKYRVFANAKIKKLKEASLAAAAQQETQAWASAQQENTIDSINRYLTAYPNGKYVEVANIKTNTLKQEVLAEIIAKINNDPNAFINPYKDTKTKLGIPMLMKYHINNLKGRVSDVQLSTLLAAYKAEATDAVAQFSIGQMYAHGFGVTKDEAESVKWYRMSAEQGNAAGLSNLAYAYKNGTGIEKNDAEAIKLFKKSAELGNSTGMNDLGACYMHGFGVTKDETEAVRWYRKSADLGNVTALTNLAYAYRNGTGIEKNDAEAIQLFLKAANLGDSYAMSGLGFAYIRGAGVIKDVGEALKWFRKSAELGNSTGMLNLGQAFMKGDGVTKNETEAVMWYKKAAELGNENAIKALQKIGQ